MSNKNKKIIMVIILLLIGLNVIMLVGIVGKKERCSNKIIKQKSSVSQSQIIEYYKKMIADYDKEEHSYSVKDINNDGIPELFIYTGGVIGNLIIANTYVYTYDENKESEDTNYVIYIGTLHGRIDNDTIFYKMNDGSLLSIIGKQGYETVSSYVLENDWLVRDNIYSKEVSKYTTGDEEIIFNPCNDLSSLEQYK